MPQTHELNSFAGSFEHLVSGAKRSDIRANDRDYQVGDVVTFKEGWPEMVNLFTLAEKYQV